MTYSQGKVKILKDRELEKFHFQESCPKEPLRTLSTGDTRLAKQVK
jgi:hypothetical protein